MEAEEEFFNVSSLLFFYRHPETYSMKLSWLNINNFPSLTHFPLLGFRFFLLSFHFFRESRVVESSKGEKERASERVRPLFTFCML